MTDSGLDHTWDGLPVAPDNPRGAMVVVRRADGHDGVEYLMLHRAHRGPDYEGDWAWTPPSGARLPGEPVLTGVWRELAEEAGLGPADLSPAGLVPVDLSAGWALTAAEIGADTAVRLDAEHDMFTWLPLPDALARCQPSAPADNLRSGAAVPLPLLTFRPLTRADLPALVAWQHAPHVAPWFPDALDLAGAQQKYGPRIDGTSPTMVHVMLADGQACGFVQHYDVAAHPDYQAAVGGLDAIGLDFAIGVPALTGRGLGAQFIWRYLQQVVFPAWPRVPYVVASPDARNTRSIRALEKAGFTRSHEIPGDPGRPELLCVLDRARIFGDLSAS
ncbi:MAG TPA: GNAT family N-acetyltransferase [Streptosporangiaceae bacterium]|jgi:RimJ/RimL family protein N-acetyltransferase/8-oxo-dGTP pyrophosphatase MutT (NUDIX family)